MTRLPVLDPGLLLELVTADIPSAVLDAPATTGDIARAIERLFGPQASMEGLELPPAPRLRQVYAALVASDRFRIACGRISASYAW
jgi:hypothetical protein